MGQFIQTLDEDFAAGKLPRKHFSLSHSAKLPVSYSFMFVCWPSLSQKQAQSHTVLEAQPLFSVGKMPYNVTIGPQ